MHSTLWYIFTFGIPFLGVLICGAGGAFGFRQAKLRRMGRVSVAVCYLAASMLPFGLAWMAVKLGGYLGQRHKNYSFFGEETWALFVCTVCYLGLVVVANVALWVALALMRSKPGNENASV